MESPGPGSLSRLALFWIYLHNGRHDSGHMCLRLLTVT